jgi:hypothetical protein
MKIVEHPLDLNNEFPDTASGIQNLDRHGGRWQPRTSPGEIFLNGVIAGMLLAWVILAFVLANFPA